MEPAMYWEKESVGIRRQSAVGDLHLDSCAGGTTGVTQGDT
jgi:hypothetical protein